MRLLAALLALAALAAPALAHASDGVPVTLKARPEAAADTITLGDVFDGAGAAAAVEIGRAPEPGQTRTFEPAWLARTAADHGLAWAGAGDVLRVVVTRASHEIAASTLEQLVADALARQEGGRWIVALAAAQTLHAPLSADLAPAVVAVRRDAVTGTVAAEITLGPDLRARRVSGRAEPAVDLPVLARPIARDGVITAADVSWTQVAASQAPHDAILDASALIGLAAKRSLRAGGPVRAFDVERPSVIEKGDSLMVVFQTRGLTLTARARALSDAAAGDTLRVVNLQSNRSIDVVAVGPGEARVASGMASVAGGRP